MADSREKQLVLVTGGSGFIATWCIVKCLSANYRVRTTVRSLRRENDVRKMLAAADVTDFSGLSFVEADLTNDNGWDEAVKGCTFVLHVASPFPAAAPKDEDDLIIPAREGTLRVLRASRDAGVKRIVITSSFAAIHGGHTKRDSSQLFTEKDWSNLNSPSMTRMQRVKLLPSALLGTLSTSKAEALSWLL
jgi:dihydroflavonol-4-reductase